MVFAYNISLCEYGKRTLPKKFALLVPFSHASCFFSGLSVFIVFASDQSVTRTDWSRPEVSIHGAGQMDRSLWGRECGQINLHLKRFARISLHFMQDPVQPCEFENGLLDSLTWLTQTKCAFFHDSGHGNGKENDQNNNAKKMYFY